jgi:hypothetical protein
MSGRALIPGVSSRKLRNRQHSAATPELRRYGLFLAAQPLPSALNEK